MFWNDVWSRVFVTTSEVGIVHFPITEIWKKELKENLCIDKLWDGVCAKFVDIFVLYYKNVIDVCPNKNKLVVRCQNDISRK